MTPSNHEATISKAIARGKYEGATLAELSSSDLHDLLRAARNPSVAAAIRGILTARRRFKVRRRQPGKLRSR